MYSAEQRERALRLVESAVEIVMDTEYHDEPQEDYKQVAIDLQCQLNRGVELLREIEKNDRDWDATRFMRSCRYIRDFLSRYPEGDKQ